MIKLYLTYNYLYKKYADFLTKKNSKKKIFKKKNKKFLKILKILLKTVKKTA
tara:strand:- start:727 stop:882 length:156 start_codon:yes stop_codon:yes gene_type:complete